MSDLTRYHRMVSDLASRALSAGDVNSAGEARSDSEPHSASEPGRVGPDGLPESPTVAMALPAARLLLGQAPPTTPGDNNLPGLVSGFKQLAEWGTPYSTVGVTPGMTAVVPKATDDDVSPDAHSTSPGTGALMLPDSAGHVRDVYHPLVLHLHLAAFARGYESMPVDVWSACEDAVPEAVAPARAIEAWTETPPLPEVVPLALWHALCLLEEAMLTRRDVDIEIVDAVVHQVVETPGEAGSLHPRGEHESLDAWVYAELTGLHALANIALHRRNRAWAARVEQVATHHLHRTQPDYVTYQPWGVFAFAWSDKTRPFADQQLHDAASAVQGGVAEPGAAVMIGLLLADAAEALSAFVGGETTG